MRGVLVEVARRLSTVLRGDDTPEVHVQVAYGDAAEAVLILEALAAALRARAANSPPGATNLADQVERTARALGSPLGRRMEQDRQQAGGDLLGEWTRDLHGTLPL